MANGGFLQNLDAIGGGLLAGPNAAISQFLGGGGGGGGLTANQAATLEMKQQALDEANKAAEVLAPTLIPLLDEVGTPFARQLSSALSSDPARVLAAMGGPEGFSKVIGFITKERGEQDTIERMDRYETTLADPAFTTLPPPDQFKRLITIFGPERANEVEKIVQNLNGAGQDLLEPSEQLVQRDRIATRYKPFRDSIDAFYSMVDTVGDPETTTAAGDIATVFQFMRVLDPTSTVREGEQATVENARGVPDRWRTLWNKLLTGERLSPNQRRDLLQTARNVTTSRVERQAEQEVGDRAALKGLVSPERASAILQGLTLTPRDRQLLPVDLSTVPEGELSFEGVVP